MSRTVKRAIRTRNPNYRYRYLKANPKDTGKNIAWLALIGAGAYGIYKYFIEPPEPPPPPVYTCPYCDAIFATKAELDAHILAEHPEVPEPPVEGEWLPANTPLSQKAFQVTITEPIVGDWRPANMELASKPFLVTIREPVVGDWLPANTELARQLFSVSIGEVVVEEYYLTTEASPWDAGYVVKEPDKPEYSAGEQVRVWAEVYTSGYAFDHWGGDASGTWSPKTITMDRDRHVIAYFEEVAPPPEEYSLSVSVSPEVGYVEVAPSEFTYREGDVVTLTAYLYSGYEDYYYLDHWTVNGVAQVGNPINIVMDGNKVVVARFIWSGVF